MSFPVTCDSGRARAGSDAWTPKKCGQSQSEVRLSAHRIASSATVPTLSGEPYAQRRPTPSNSPVTQKLQPGILGITAGDQKCLSPIDPTAQLRACSGAYP